MKIEELNHIAIYVKDVEASIRFYKEVLGLEQLPRPAFKFPGAWFRLGLSQELHLIGNRTEEMSFNKRHHFALKVNSATEAEAFLKSKTIEFTRSHRPDGAIQLFFHDPDGYYIELYQFDG